MTSVLSDRSNLLLGSSESAAAFNAKAGTPLTLSKPASAADLSAGTPNKQLSSPRTRSKQQQQQTGALIQWVKQRITIKADGDAATNLSDHDTTISEFLFNPSINTLFAYYDSTLQALVVTTRNALPVQPQSADATGTADVTSTNGHSSPHIHSTIQYFYKLSHTTSPLHITTIGQHLQYGVYHHTTLDGLLSLMSHVFLTAFTHTQWPDTVKKDVGREIHKFMSTLTEQTYGSRGHTVLYLPDIDFPASSSGGERSEMEEKQLIVTLANDKDLVQRLESTLIHWSRQIKEVLANGEHHSTTSGSSSGASMSNDKQHNGSSNASLTNTSDSSGPLEEIGFWRSRTADLTGLKQQLERPGVKRIVAVLRYVHSSYLKPFETLAALIQNGSTEATHNLELLSILQPLCQEFTTLTPSQIPTILPQLLQMIRLITNVSPYYNTYERLTGLLRKISNQIIIQCMKSISLHEIFDGDVEGSMLTLQQSIACSDAWHRTYQQTVQLIASDTQGKLRWDFDPQRYGIFAQIDAFVQRCVNLLEICEGQLQFARRWNHLRQAARDKHQKLLQQSENDKPHSLSRHPSLRAQQQARLHTSAGSSAEYRCELPCFGGTKGSEIEKSLLEIELAFEKAIYKLRTLDYNILNVKVTAWHSDYNTFKAVFKDLEVMIHNIFLMAWQFTGSIAESIHVIECFSMLAVRPALRQAVDKKVIDLFNTFQQECKRLKSLYEQYKKLNPLQSIDDPKYGAQAKGCHALLARLNSQYNALQLLSSIQNITLPVTDVNDAANAYESLKSMFEQYVRTVHSDWIESLNQAVNEGQNALANDGTGVQLSDRLAIPLLVRVVYDAQNRSQRVDPNTGLRPPQQLQLAGKHGHQSNTRATLITYLESNFDPHLLRTFAETRYWEKYHGTFPIPYAVHEIYLQHDQLRLLREHINIVVREYNHIISQLTEPSDRQLFSVLIRSIDVKLAPGLTKLTWNDKHLREYYINKVRERCHTVLAIVEHYQHTNRMIEQHCSDMSALLLLDIQKNQIYEAQEFIQRQHEHEVVVSQKLQYLHTTIYNLLTTLSQFFIDTTDRDVLRQWQRYVEHVDLKVEQALKVCVKKTLLLFYSYLYVDQANNGGAGGAMSTPSPAAASSGTSSSVEAHNLFALHMQLDDVQGKIDFTPTLNELQIIMKNVSKQCITLIQPLKRLTMMSMQQQSAVVQVDSNGNIIDPNKSSGVVVQSQNYYTSNGGLQHSVSTDIDLVHTDTVNNFYDVISKDDEILKILVHIMSSTSLVANDLQKIVSHYDRYAPVWNTDKVAFMRRYAATKRPLSSFEMDINRYKNNQFDVNSEDQYHSVGFVRIDCTSIKNTLIQHCQQWQLKLTTLLHTNATTELNALTLYYSESQQALQQLPSNLDELSTQLVLLQRLESEYPVQKQRLEPLIDTYKTLDKFDVAITEDEKELLEKLRVKIDGFAQVLASGREQLLVRRNEMKMNLESNAEEFTASVDTLKQDFTSSAPYTGPTSIATEVVNSTIQSALTLLQSFQQRITHGRQTYAMLTNGVKVFDNDKIGSTQAVAAPQQLPSSSLTPTELDSVESELQLLEKVWQMYQQWQQSYDTWQQSHFGSLDVKAIEQTVNTTQKAFNKLTRQCKQWSVTQCLIQAVTTFKQLLPLFTNLRSPAFKERHWNEFSAHIKQQLAEGNDNDGETIFDIQDEVEFTLSYVMSYNVVQYTDTINQLTVHAEREYTIDQHLQQIDEVWNGMAFTLIPYIKNNNPSAFHLFTKFDVLNDQLEHDTLLLSGIKHSPSYHVFATVVDHWQGLLMNVSEVLELLSSVQTNWKYLETIFLDSVEISKQLPHEVEKFLAVHKQWLTVVQAVQDDTRLLQHLPPHSSLIDTLQHQMEQLERIQHSLDQFLQQKRIIYPRFYFLSNENLLELLGAARDLTVINKHIHKFFAGIQTLDYTGGTDDKPTIVTAIRGKDNEVFPVLKPIVVEGDVEQWLINVDIQMVDTLEKVLQTSLLTVTKVGGYHRCTPQQLLPLFNSMLGSMLILSGQIIWTSKITASLMDLSSGKNLKSLKKLKLDWYEYITRLSTLLRTADLTALDRSKVNNQMVVEVHARDVLNRLRAMQKINRLHANSFEWMSQLRFYYDKTGTVRSHHSSNPHLDTKRHDYGLCYIQQTNTQFDYGYEYVGNIGRLVITPLTDRCYMTLTTALSLYRGGSPLGPAGTGKTETVKDLAKNMGKLAIVYNCSPEMSVSTLAQNLCGLAQTGAWGCFDEFNRIQIDVLSVIALQISAVLDAIKSGSTTFTIDGQTLPLNRSVGLFVTMNPDYAGRSELPDNLKSVFRPVAMMAPESTMIAEISLLAEGFNDAKSLARKVIAVYSLMEKQLTKQSHYAYGLRALKSVLSRAGQLMRSNAVNEWSEEIMLMRALIDMNASKLTASDLQLFDGIVHDLFVGIDLPPQQMTTLQSCTSEQMQQRGLQVHDVQIQRMLQLNESIHIRHGNMVVGSTMSGKSVAWQVLAAALTAQYHATNGKEGKLVETFVINPKAVTTDEFYGYFDAANEWHDGVFSSCMRNICVSSTQSHKWLVLDGPVDTLWIESLNTVLDDNKILTLINGDRIVQPHNVQLLFEVNDLAAASPATVSRCGIVYMDESLLGWKQIALSWGQGKLKLIEQRDKLASGGQPAAGSSSEASQYQTLSDYHSIAHWSKSGLQHIQRLFDRYLTPIISAKQRLQQAVPVNEVSLCRALCQLFDSIVTSEVVGSHINEVAADADYLRLLEMYFSYCVVWAIGSTYTPASRTEFDSILRDVDTSTAYPAQSTVFDYYVDVEQKQWKLWESRLAAIDQWQPPSPAMQHSMLVVPTIDTLRYSAILNALMAKRYNVLIAGGAGSGKSLYASQWLSQADTDTTVTAKLVATANTTAQLMQEWLELRLEKRQRSNYGPIDGKQRMVAVIEDVHLIQPTEYGSTPATEILRQFLAYGYWYDRKKLQAKHATDVSFIATVQPTQSSRPPMDPRTQSQFQTLSVNSMTDASVSRIFQTILHHHLHATNFSAEVRTLVQPLSQASINLYQTVSNSFLPTPTPAACHYLWTWKQVFHVLQGLMQADASHYTTRDSMLRLWWHENNRAYGDRLGASEDQIKYEGMLGTELQSCCDTTIKKLTGDASDDIQAPLFGSFLPPEENDPMPVLSIQVGDEVIERPIYRDITKKMVVSATAASDDEESALKQYMSTVLEQHNTTHLSTTMSLVLFDDVLQHVTQLHRILSSGQQAVLVGIGGSGRQSCARMVATMLNAEIFTCTVTRSYKRADFREQLKNLYRQTGVAEQLTVFIWSDAQLTDPPILDDLHSLLCTVDIPLLFSDEELSGICDELRADAQQHGLNLTNTELYDYFIQRVRTNLRVVLCMSPVSTSWRSNVRLYPSLVQQCSIIYFHAWPTTALQEVAVKLITDEDLQTNALAVRPSRTTGSVTATLKDRLISLFCDCHRAATEVSLQMYSQLRRQTYVTASHFVDAIALYKFLLAAKRASITASIEKFKSGVDKLEYSAAQVASMQAELSVKQQEVAAQKETCDALLLEIVAKQRAADEQARQVQLDKSRTEKEASDCQIIQQEAQLELDSALPALMKAVAALEKLSKAAVTEVKSYPNPPKPVERVMSAVMTILEKQTDWATAKRELSDPAFLQKLKQFDKDKISNATLKAIGKYTKNTDFNPDEISNVSIAAGALCEWVCAMEMYAKVFRDVEPRRVALKKAEDSLHNKQTELARAEAALGEVMATVASLQQRFAASESEAAELKAETERLEARLEAANQLVAGLAGEKQRWQTSMTALHADLEHVVGDCALAAIFLSYAGSLPAAYRQTLIRQTAMTAIKKYQLPYTTELNIVQFLLSSPTDLLDWQIQGLPADAFSTENGVLVVHSNRWPLAIDPQGQAHRWLSAREADNHLVLVDLSTASDVAKLENAIVHGYPCLIENVGLSIDSVLDPLLRIDRHSPPPASITFNDKLIAYNRNFRLYLCSPLANPTFSPEVYTRLAVINFAVVNDGLQEQLLSYVVQHEESQLEADKRKLVQASAAGKRKLQQLEDEILSLLSSSSNNLLDDDSLIRALNQSKATGAELSKQLAESAITSTKIDTAREQYRAVAVRAALCYFVLVDLSSIDSMYHFSLPSYIALYNQSIVNSRAASQQQSSQPSSKYSMMPSHNTTSAVTPSIDLNDRIVAINTYHTRAVFQHTCLGLFERHKLLLAMLLTVARLQQDQAIDAVEHDFLLRGGVVLDRNQRPANSCSEWLTEVQWDAITELDKLPAFNGIVRSMEQNGSDWRQWLHADDPPCETLPPPADWHHLDVTSNTAGSSKARQPIAIAGSKGAAERKTSFHLLLLLKCLRPDRLINAARRFIALNLGSEYMDPPTLDLNAVYQNSVASVPLLFILSPGVDPVSQVSALASRHDQQLEVIALGQGQTESAEQMITHAAQTGRWLYIANCHLSIQWLPILDKIVAGFAGRASTDPAAQTKTVHPAFRLWLSSNPTSEFPVNLLQTCTKITTELPTGMRANMQRLYNTQLSESELVAERASPVSAALYRKLVFSLAWFHTILNERKRFLQLGWNISYAFNDSDFAVCKSLLAAYCDEYQKQQNDAEAVEQQPSSNKKIEAADDTAVTTNTAPQSTLPWDALRYLIGQANYGGRVTDANDRKLLDAYTLQYFNENVISTSRYNLAPTTGVDMYVIPEQDDIPAVRKYLQHLPRVEDGENAEIFGAHNNANIGSQLAATRLLLTTIAALQPKAATAASASSGGGGQTREQQVLQTITLLNEQIPQMIDTRAIKRKYNGDLQHPLSIVLQQECQLYNELLTKIHTELHSLQRAMNGYIILTQGLEDACEAIYNNRTPASWTHLYPSNKPLSSWVRDLTQRITQFKRWLEDSQEPRSYWLAGFVSPIGFLTALLQMTSRQNRVPIESLGWEFIVMSNTSEKDLPARPEEGAFIRGLYLEGARWDSEVNGLTDAAHMELHSELPIIHFKPIDQKKRNPAQMRYTYSAPMYIYPIRAGMPNKPAYLLDVFLHVGAKDWQYWIKRGTAVLLALDE